MLPFADAGDVAAIWRPLTDAEIDVVSARIAQASRIVRRRVPTVDDKIAAEEVSVDDVRDIVVDMVYRFFTVGYARTGSVTVDDGSVSNTWDASVSGRGLFMTDDEVAFLTGDADMEDGRSYSITPGW